MGVCGGILLRVGVGGGRVNWCGFLFKVPLVLPWAVEGQDGYLPGLP